MANYEDQDTQVLKEEDLSGSVYKKSQTDLLLDAIVNEETYEDFKRKYEKNLNKKSFVNEFRRMMVDKGFEVSKLMRLTGFSKSYCYQLLNDERKPSRDAVISISIALSCDLEAANAFLKLSEKQELYARNARDSILIYAITHGYSLEKTNELLRENEQQLL